MKVFPLLSLEYDGLKKIVFGMDICEAVSLAMMSDEIRNMRLRELEIIKTPKTCVMYTGAHYEEASIMLMEHLLTMFKSSKVHINFEGLSIKALRLLMTCEAFNYVHRMSIGGITNPKISMLEKVFMEEAMSPRIRQLLPEYRPVVVENIFRTESAIEWIEDFHARNAPRVQMELLIDPPLSNLIKSTIDSWQQGKNSFSQDLKLHCLFGEHSYEFPYILSVFDGLENSKCWETLGKRADFNKHPNFRLIRGNDITRQDGNCASLFLYEYSSGIDKSMFMEIITWKPATVA